MKSAIRIPHPYVIIFTIIVIAVALSWLVPAGEFDRITITDPNSGRQRTVVDAASFHAVEQNALGFFDIFLAIPAGMKSAASIIFFVFIVAGSFNIVTATGAIHAGVGKLAVFFQKGNKLLMIPVFSLLFAVFGATIGLSEECIVFIPIGIMLARSLGFDAIVGMAMIVNGAAVGFNSGIFNPFTVGVAQGIAELPLFSGFEFRLVVWAVLLLVTNIYLLRYAKKVLNDPSASIVCELEQQEKKSSIDLEHLPELTARLKLVLALVVIGFAVLVFGIFQYGWYIDEIVSLFIILGLACGIVGGLNGDKIIEAFLAGARSIVAGALIIGLARGIMVVLQDGRIIDSIINSLALSVAGLPKTVAAIGIYFVQVIINFFIPSGSGQAATTMPIIAPLADLIGINRQIAVLAYQFGDGFTNSIIPTGGSLMAWLSISKIGYDKWVKFIGKLMLLWLLTGILFMVLAVSIDYGPF